MPDYYYGFLIILGLLIVLAALVAKRRSSKIDHLPPEHRAKENELYEAFGLEKPHEKKPPAGHEEKGKEIKTAFESGKVTKKEKGGRKKGKRGRKGKL
ncbi:hypothetical protein JXD20_01965 [Candidatus Peregrinibacteria bacterium]|nr:hypothetical protein [Candidatus Peregrinibacteria bacterium]